MGVFEMSVSQLFFKSDARTMKWTLLVKNEHIPQNIMSTFSCGKKNIFVDEPLGICHHCDKGNILRNKYLAAQSWMRIPIKIEFHEFHLFSFLRVKVLKYAYLICMAFKKC